MKLLELLAIGFDTIKNKKKLFTNNLKQKGFLLIN